MTTQQPDAQERKFWKRLCAINRFSFFYMGGGVARASDKSGNWIEVHSAQEIVDDAECEVGALTARITELESQLAQRFDAADLPEALRRSTAADGKTELFNLPGYPLMVRAVDFNRIHTESEMRRAALLDETQKTALAAGQATAAQAVVQDDLITIRRPTTRAELLWLLKLAHLVISDVDKTLEETFAPAQPAAQQGAAYAALPEKYYLAGGEVPTWDAKQMHAFADATHALRASHGQAPAWAGEAAEHYRNAIARARLLDSDLSNLAERGAKAWAGVDAQGLRDGVASLSANAGEPRNAIDRDALIDALAQGLHGTWHSTRVWEAWHVGTMSQDDFEPVDESETPTEIAEAVLALLAAPPTAQAEGWRPIETAPKDGQAILVADGMDCYCVEWDEEFDWWTVDDNKLGPFRLRGSAPTHWMPLPAAPGPADGESNG